MAESLSIPARQLELGDVLTVPGTIHAPCRVRGIRTAAPGLIWLHLVDIATERQVPYRITLTVDQQVTVHERSSRRTETMEERPDDN